MFFSASLDSPFEVKRDDIIHSKTTRYKVLKFNGEGSFGKVAKCLDLNTYKTVAVKVHKESDEYYIYQELEMLQAIKGLDPEQYNIVSFMEHFRYRKLSFMSFEMLDKSLWDFMVEQRWVSLPLNDIRYVTRQLLVALDGLKSIGIMHTDLKLDNIMLVDHHGHPFKTKLIDFGLAMREYQAEVGTIIQNRTYRAPEVNLGLPLTTAVDMWGLGCIIFELFFGRRIFPGNCDYNNMRAIVSLMGFPEDNKLKRGKYSHLYFTRGLGGISRLRSPMEYEDESGKICELEWSFCDEFRTLDEAVLSRPGCQDAHEYSDRMAFLDFLKSCLTVDADQRISPRRALTHYFITNTKMDQMQGGIYDSSADHPVLDIHINTDHSSSGFCRLSGGESYNERSIAIEPPAPPNLLFIDAIIPDEHSSKNEEDGATPAKIESGNGVVAASDSARLIDDQERASEHENIVNQEQKERDTTPLIEVMQHLCNNINELQHNYDEMKRLFEVEQETAKALREELRLMKENNIEMQTAKTSAPPSPQENVLAPQDLMEEEKEQTEEEKDLEEQVVEPAPELSHVNRNQSLNVSEQPVPMKKKRLSWWQRVKKFFTGARRHHESHDH